MQESLRESTHIRRTPVAPGGPFAPFFDMRRNSMGVFNYSMGGV